MNGIILWRGGKNFGQTDKGMEDLENSTIFMDVMCVSSLMYVFSLNYRQVVELHEANTYEKKMLVERCPQLSDDLT